MCSESTVAFGQPSETKPTFGIALFIAMLSLVIRETIHQSGKWSRFPLQSALLAGECRAVACVYAIRESNRQRQHKSCLTQPVPAKSAQRSARTATQNRTEHRRP